MYSGYNPWGVAEPFQWADRHVSHIRPLFDQNVNKALLVSLEIEQNPKFFHSNFAVKKDLQLVTSLCASAVSWCLDKESLHT